MKIIAISDTHNQHNQLDIPHGDVLIHCGDFTNNGTFKEIDKFAEWFGGQPHKYKIVVFGNHEVSLDSDFYDTHWKKFHKNKVVLCEDYWINKGIITLTNEYTIIENNGKNYKIWGHPSLPWEQDYWAWNFDSWYESDRIFSNIDRDVDIILTHSPPYGILDKTRSGVCIGNEEFSVYVNDIRPRLCIFGHVHNPGFYINECGTYFYNVAMCNDTIFGPQLVHKPTIIELD